VATIDRERFDAVNAAMTALVRALGKVAEEEGPLAALGLTRRSADELTAELRTRVYAALVNGATWERIGGELGVSRQTAFSRYKHLDPRRWDGAAPRCAAAGLLDGNAEACEGDQDAAWVLDSVRIPTDEQKRRDGVLACVRHGAELYAGYLHARVYPTGGPDDPRKAALEIYHRAQGIKTREGRA
jgi:hypothetical protein